MAKKMYEILLNLPIFQGVSPGQMTSILEVVPFEFRKYSKGEVIVNTGDICEGVLFLVSGKLIQEKPMYDSRVIVRQMFEAPHTFPIHRLFGPDQTVRSTMIAAENKTGTMLLRKTDFMQLLCRNQITMINSMNMLCTKAQKQHLDLDFLALKDPLIKLSSWLLTYSEQRAKEVEVIADEADWCTMLNLDTAAFWRSVAMLEGLHLLESEKGKLKLLDRYALKSFVFNKTAQND